MSKDMMKETLFETLGWSDREWSRKLSRAAHDLLFEFAACLLFQEQSCILEANFRSDCTQRTLETLKSKHEFRVIQIFLWAQPMVLQRRSLERARLGDRHPGHLDSVLQQEYCANSIPPNQMMPVKTEGPILWLETTYIDAALAADQRMRAKAWLQGLGVLPNMTGDVPIPAAQHSRL